MSAVYFHIPFCKQACHYCNFHFSTSFQKKDLMVETMIKELELRKNELDKNQPIESIYFGGGTPSLLSPKEIKKLIRAVETYFEFHSNIEITLEMNPDDNYSNFLEELKSVGVNRLSIGIQSFFEDELKMMNRAHSVQHAIEILEYTCKVFENFSLDLIYGMPDSNIEKWTYNVEQALQFNPTHISSYALTVEPKTVLHRQVSKKQIEVLEEESVLAQFNFLLDKLEKEGFTHYESSNFAKPGFHSINNTAYWNGKSYLGIGPSAHSYNGETRRWNVANNMKYIKGVEEKASYFESETLSEADRYNEYLMTGLRTQKGVSLHYIEEEFGEQYKLFTEKQAQKYLETQMIFWEEDFLKVTRKAKFLVDGIASDFFMIND